MNVLNASILWGEVNGIELTVFILSIFFIFCPDVSTRSFGWLNFYVHWAFMISFAFLMLVPSPQLVKADENEIFHWMIEYKDWILLLSVKQNIYNGSL